MHDGVVAVQGDGHQDERRQVEAERAPEHHDSAHEVAGLPGHRHVPDRLQRQHDEGHDQVGDGEVHDEGVHAGAKAAVAKQRDEHGEVAGRSDDEQTAVGDHRHQGVVREHHLVGEGHVGPSTQRDGGGGGRGGGGGCHGSQHEER